MKFKVDENLPVEVAFLFRDAGFEADTVYDEKIGGEADALIFDRCKQERMVLITLDLDFSDIRNYSPHTHQGIIVLKLKNQSKSKIIQHIKKVISIIKHEKVQGCL